jgi:pimeloyl-ACP methyl ester carboxylesterase
VIAGPEVLVVPAPGGAGLVVERAAAGGPSVVLLHAGVADRRAWRHVAPALHARGASVVSYDRRGFGETPAARAPFRHADDLLAVLDATSPGPAWLVGNSQGGLIALDVALGHPDRVAGLVLIAPAVGGAPDPEDHELDPDTLRLAAALERAEEDEDVDAANRLEVELWLDGPAGPAGRVGGPARALALAMNRTALQSGQAEDAGRGDEDAWSRLGEVRVPVTLAWGALDLPYLRALCRELAGRLPDVRRAVELPGVAHLPGVERPDLVAALVAEAVGLGD